jgi:uncharacterized protein (DUF58 family)
VGRGTGAILAVKRRYHLHIPGFIYLGLVLIIAVAAMNSQNNLLFWIFGVMFSGLLVSGIMSGVMMLGLRVRRLDPRHGTVGEPLTIRYALTNRHRLFPAFNIHIEERPSGGRATWRSLLRCGSAWVMHVGPRETVHGEALGWPLRRGEVRFDALRIWTTFPFGLIKKSVTFSQPQHTHIYPRLYELRKRVFDAVVPHSTMGARISPRPGAGDDYFGLREYRPGDSLRHIAWKRTAKTDELVSIERSRPSPPRVRVVLNLALSTEALAEPHLTVEKARELEEQAISLAASLVRAADLAGYELGLSAPGAALPSIPVRGGGRHFGRIMAALASIDLDAPRREPRALPIPDAERSAFVVIHPDRVDPIVGRGDAWHLSARQLPSLVLRALGFDATAQSPADPLAPVPPPKRGEAAA